MVILIFHELWGETALKYRTGFEMKKSSEKTCGRNIPYIRWYK